MKFVCVLLVFLPTFIEAQDDKIQKIIAPIEKTEIYELVCERITSGNRDPFASHRLSFHEKEWGSEIVKAAATFLQDDDILNVMLAVNVISLRGNQDAVKVLCKLIASDRQLSGMYCSEYNGIRTYSNLNVREDAVEGLGRFADQRAIPFLKALLDPPENYEMSGYAAAKSLYQITKKQFKYRNDEGVVVLWEPPEHQ